MTTSLFVGLNAAPALGDIRSLFPGDTIYLRPDADQRDDWGRYLDAIAHAIAHGVDVRWVRA